MKSWGKRKPASPDAAEEIETTTADAAASPDAAEERAPDPHEGLVPMEHPDQDVYVVGFREQVTKDDVGIFWVRPEDVAFAERRMKMTKLG